MLAIECTASKMLKPPPISVLSRVDTLAAKKVVCVTLRELPTRPQFLKLKDEPMCRKSTTDMELPNRAADRSEAHEPMHM
jgi:hypothetical protein